LDQEIFAAADARSHRLALLLSSTIVFCTAHFKAPFTSVGLAIGENLQSLYANLSIRFVYLAIVQSSLKQLRTAHQRLQSAMQQ